ncbi:MAG: hypothetical protein ACRD2J_01215 [Thermoanaerobaculia bacterium]
MRIAVCAVLALLLAVPAFAQEEEGSEAEAPDYTREALRSIFLQAAMEEEARAQDPFKMGIPLFDFTIGGTKTTVRFVIPSGLIAGATGVELFPVIDPFVMTGTRGSAMSPRVRSRYGEWWVSRKLGFPISPPDDD